MFLKASLSKPLFGFSNIHMKISIDSWETCQVVVLKAGKFQQMCYCGSFAPVERIFLITARGGKCVVMREIWRDIADDVDELHAEFSHSSSKLA